MLEPLKLEHVRELWPSAKEREIWTFMSMKVESEDDFSRWVGKRLEAVSNGTALAFLQRDPKTGRAFGSTSLFDIDIRNRRAEIGHTWIGADHRRTSVNTEAKLMLFTHAFNDMNLVRVQIKTDTENVRSQKAIERLGATLEGRARNFLVYEDGSVHDRMIYSVTSQEWPRVKARLEGLLMQPHQGK